MDNWQLLQSYVERDSEMAFRTLVNRYVNLVYSVALRQVRDAHLAEEVAQAVFILLARKAHGFRENVILSGWLFRTTRFVASRAIRAEQRRQRREQEADFWQSDAGHQRLFANRTFTLDVAPDGTFSAYDIPPGNYSLFLHVQRSASGHSMNIGTLSEKVVIPEAGDSEAGAVDLGTRVLRRARE